MDDLGSEKQQRIHREDQRSPNQRASAAIQKSLQIARRNRRELHVERREVFDKICSSFNSSSVKARPELLDRFTVASGASGNHSVVTPAASSVSGNTFFAAGSVKSVHS
jgi:hypothetical protein